MTGPRVERIRRETAHSSLGQTRARTRADNASAGKALDALAGTVSLNKGVTIDLLRDRIPMLINDARSVITTPPSRCVK